MGCELGLNVWTVGGLTPAGRRRTTPATSDATWFATAFLSELTSKSMLTRLTPMELVEPMSVIPLSEERRFSMGCVTCWSMTEGVAPGKDVTTFTTGIFTAGRRSTPRPSIETTPNAKIATKIPIANT